MIHIRRILAICVKLAAGTNVLVYGTMISWNGYMRLWTNTVKLSSILYEQLPTTMSIRTYRDFRVNRCLKEDLLNAESDMLVGSRIKYYSLRM